MSIAADGQMAPLGAEGPAVVDDTYKGPCARAFNLLKIHLNEGMHTCGKRDQRCGRGVRE